MTLRKARLGALGSYFKAFTTLGFNFCKNFCNLVTSDGHLSKVILPEVLSMGLRDDLDRVYDHFVEEKSVESRRKPSFWSISNGAQLRLISTLMHSGDEAQSLKDTSS